MKCCCSTVDVEQSVEVFTEAKRTARKRHICGECREPILPKQKYWSETGLWEDTWHTFRTCLICHKIREDFCCGFTYGSVHAEIKECMNAVKFEDDGKWDWITGKQKQETDHVENTCCCTAGSLQLWIR